MGYLRIATCRFHTQNNYGAVFGVVAVSEGAFDLDMLGRAWLVCLDYDIDMLRT